MEIPWDTQKKACPLSLEQPVGSPFQGTLAASIPVSLYTVIMFSVCATVPIPGQTFPTVLEYRKIYLSWVVRYIPSRALSTVPVL